MLNLVVNKLTPAPPRKSRAAFIREYELSVNQLKFTPDANTKEWYDTLLQLQISQDNANRESIKPKIRMSPKKKAVKTSSSASGVKRVSDTGTDASAAPAQKSAKGIEPI